MRTYCTVYILVLVYSILASHESVTLNLTSYRSGTPIYIYVYVKGIFVYANVYVLRYYKKNLPVLLLVCLVEAKTYV
jgi:hypothetical protein